VPAISIPRLAQLLSSRITRTTSNMLSSTNTSFESTCTIAAYAPLAGTPGDAQGPVPATGLQPSAEEEVCPVPDAADEMKAAEDAVSECLAAQIRALQAQVEQLAEQVRAAHAECESRSTLLAVLLQPQCTRQLLGSVMSPDGTYVVDVHWRQCTGHVDKFGTCSNAFCLIDDLPAHAFQNRRRAEREARDARLDDFLRAANQAVSERHSARR
jgi:hypothetical protein